MCARAAHRSPLLAFCSYRYDGQRWTTCPLHPPPHAAGGGGGGAARSLRERACPFWDLLAFFAEVLAVAQAHAYKRIVSDFTIALRP